MEQINVIYNVFYSEIKLEILTICKLTAAQSVTDEVLLESWV